MNTYQGRDRAFLPGNIFNQRSKLQGKLSKLAPTIEPKNQSVEQFTPFMGQTNIIHDLAAQFNIFYYSNHNHHDPLLQLTVSF